DPFNFLVKYKNVFPKYKDLSWISLSNSQRSGMPTDTNWVANIYHGLDKDTFTPIDVPSNNYIAYLGRIIEPKGVHIAIKAVQHFNKTADIPLILKIAGKHYAEHSKDTYWSTHVEPFLGHEIEYIGHIKSDSEKRQFLGNARALLVPSIFDEPFGMVTIEALACGTPVIGLDRGATHEIIDNGATGYVIPYINDSDAVAAISETLQDIDNLNRKDCRISFEKRFTSDRMASDHAHLYESLVIK
ncbi:MAG: glycosyltransferase, partial [Candidatus Saccharimonadales bacterium]